MTTPLGLTLSIELLAEHPGFDPDLLGAVLSRCLSGSIELVLADPGYMRVMNRRFRHIDRPTDVLTFDMSDPGSGEPEGVIYLDCRLFPPLEEIVERVLHGYLHLCGRTHDTCEDSEEMAREVDDLMVRCGLEPRR